MNTSFKTTSELLIMLQKLAEEQSSVEILINSPEAQAKLCLREGLLVWAFAVGQKESFQSILLKERNISREELIQALKKSQESGQKNLDCILSALIDSSPEERATIMDRHNRAAVEVICRLKNCQLKVAASGAGEKPSWALPLGVLLEELSGQDDKEPRKKSSPAACLEEVLEKLRFSVPSFLAAMVVEWKTSLPLALVTEVSDLNAEETSAYYRDLLQAAVKAAEASNQTVIVEGETPLDEILISSAHSFVFLKALNQGEHFLYLLIDEQANPGLAKVALKRHWGELQQALS